MRTRWFVTAGVVIAPLAGIGVAQEGPSTNVFQRTDTVKVWEETLAREPLIGYITPPSGLAAVQIRLEAIPFHPERWNTVTIDTVSADRALKPLVMRGVRDVFGLDSLRIASYSPSGELLDADTVRVYVRDVAEFYPQPISMYWGTTVTRNLRAWTEHSNPDTLAAIKDTVVSKNPGGVLISIVSDVVLSITASAIRKDVVTDTIVVWLRKPGTATPVVVGRIPLRIEPPPNRPPRAETEGKFIFYGGYPPYKRDLKEVFFDDDGDSLAFHLVGDYDDTLHIIGDTLATQPSDPAWWGRIDGVRITASDGADSITVSVTVTVLEFRPRYPSLLVIPRMFELWEETLAREPLISYITPPSGVAAVNIRLDAIAFHPERWDTAAVDTLAADRDQKPLVIRGAHNLFGLDSLRIESYSPSGELLDVDTMRVYVRDVPEFHPQPVRMYWGTIVTRNLRDWTEHSNTDTLAAIEDTVVSKNPDGVQAWIGSKVILTITASDIRRDLVIDTIVVWLRKPGSTMPVVAGRIPLRIEPAPNRPPRAETEGKFVFYGGYPPYKRDLKEVFFDDDGDSLIFSLPNSNPDSVIVGNDTLFVAIVGDTLVVTPCTASDPAISGQIHLAILATDGHVSVLYAITVTILEPLRTSLHNNTYTAMERSVLLIRLSDFVYPRGADATWFDTDTTDGISVLGYIGNEPGAQERYVRVHVGEVPDADKTRLMQVAFLVTDHRGPLTLQPIRDTLSVLVQGELHTPPAFRTDLDTLRFYYGDTAKIRLPSLTQANTVVQPYWEHSFKPEEVINYQHVSGSSTIWLWATSPSSQGVPVAWHLTLTDRYGRTPSEQASVTVTTDQTVISLDLAVVVNDTATGFDFSLPDTFVVAEDTKGQWWLDKLVTMRHGQPRDMIWDTCFVTGDGAITARFDTIAEWRYLVLEPAPDHATVGPSSPRIALEAHLPGRRHNRTTRYVLIRPIFDLEVPPQEILEGSTADVPLAQYIVPSPLRTLEYVVLKSARNLEVVRIDSNCRSNPHLIVRPKQITPRNSFVGVDSILIGAKLCDGTDPAARDSAYIVFTVKEIPAVPPEFKANLSSEVSFYRGDSLMIALDTLLVGDQPPNQPRWTASGEPLFNAKLDQANRIVTVRDTGGIGTGHVTLRVEQWILNNDVPHVPTEFALKVTVLPRLEIVVDREYSISEGLCLPLNLSLAEPPAGSVKWRILWRSDGLRVSLDSSSSSTPHLVVQPSTRIRQADLRKVATDSFAIEVRDLFFDPPVRDVAVVKMYALDVPNSPPEFRTDLAVCPDDSLPCWEVFKGETRQVYLDGMLATGPPDDGQWDISDVPSWLHVRIDTALATAYLWCNPDSANDTRVMLRVIDRVHSSCASRTEAVLYVSVKRRDRERVNVPPKLTLPGVLTIKEDSVGQWRLSELAEDDYTPDYRLKWTFHSIGDTTIKYYVDTVSAVERYLRISAPEDYYTETDVPLSASVMDQDGASSGIQRFFIRIIPIPDLRMDALWVPANRRTVISLRDSGLVEWPHPPLPERYQDIQLTFKSFSGSSIIDIRHVPGTDTLVITPRPFMKAGRDTFQVTLYDQRNKTFDLDTLVVAFGDIFLSDGPFFYPQPAWRAYEGHPIVVLKDSLVYDERVPPESIDIRKVSGCPWIEVDGDNSPYVIIRAVDKDANGQCDVKLGAWVGQLVSPQTLPVTIIFDEVHDIVLKDSTWVVRDSVVGLLRDEWKVIRGDIWATIEDSTLQIPLDRFVQPPEFRNRLVWSLNPIPHTDEFGRSIDSVTQILTLVPPPDKALADWPIQLVARDATTHEADTVMAYFRVRLIDDEAPEWRWDRAVLNVYEEGETIFPRTGSLTDSAHVEDRDTRLSDLRIEIENSLVHSPRCSVRIVENRYVVIQPRPNWFGRDTIWVRVIDPGRNYDDARIFLEVMPVDNDFPTLVTIEVPEDGSNHFGGRPAFRWHGGEDPDGTRVLYTLRISSDRAGTNVYGTYTTDSLYAECPVVLSTAQYYYWRVNSTSVGTADTAYSPTYRFSTFPNDSANTLRPIHPTAAGVATAESLGVFVTEQLPPEQQDPVPRAIYRLFISTNDQLHNARVASSNEPAIQVADSAWWRQLAESGQPLYYRVAAFADYSPARIRWTGPPQLLRTAPNPPRIVPFPLSPPISRDTTVTRTWTSLPETDRRPVTYSVYIADKYTIGNTDTTKHDTVSNLAQQMWTFTADNFRHTFRWRVETVKGNLAAPSLEDVFVLAPFVGRAVENNDRPDRPPMFSWMPYMLYQTGEARRYLLEISTDPAFTNPIRFPVPLDSTRYRPMYAYIPKGVYYWRVLADDQPGSRPTPSRSFVMSSTVEQPPYWPWTEPLQELADGRAIRATGNVVFSWLPARDPNASPADASSGLKYEVRLFREGIPFAVLDPTDTTFQSWAVKRIYDNTRFRWTVVVSDVTELAVAASDTDWIFVRLFEFLPPFGPTQVDTVLRLTKAPMDVRWQPYAFVDLNRDTVLYATTYRVVLRRFDERSPVKVDDFDVPVADRMKVIIWPWSSAGIGSGEEKGDYLLTVMPKEEGIVQNDGLQRHFVIGEPSVWYNRPNPFHNRTEFVLENPKRPGSDVSLIIYAASGMVVTEITLSGQNTTPNKVHYMWNVPDLPHGLYAGVLRIDGQVRTDLGVLKLLVAPVPEESP